MKVDEFDADQGVGSTDRPELPRNQAIPMSRTMLKAKRDTLLGGARFAIPSIGEVEGRMMVLEMIALASLSRLLDEKQAKTAAALPEIIRRAVKIKCCSAKLSEDDSRSAQDYADELIEAAREAIGRANRRQAG
jgi:hypothetical protein